MTMTDTQTHGNDIRSDGPSGVAWRIKQAIDWTIALILFVLLLPLLLMIALAIKLDSRGPVFFRQPRFGKDTQPFKIFKFRTMYVDQGDIRGAQQTRHNDPRITRVGMILRKTSLDELPQLLNILAGQMALIGPRAHPCGMKVDGVLCDDIDPRYHQRHRVKPGVSGWAQINGSRGPVDTRDQLVARVDLDLDYIGNWCPGKEARVYLRTLRVVLSAAGAR